jgi:hypothetical protein
MAGWDASGGEKAGTVGVLGGIGYVVARQLGGGQCGSMGCCVHGTHPAGELSP